MNFINEQLKKIINKNNMEELNLKPIKAYEIFASNDDRGRGSIIGYYKELKNANVDKIGCGYYGADGEVRDVTLYTDGSTLYKVKTLGFFTDEHQKYKEDTIKKIKEKLSKAEIDFLGI